MYKCNWCGKDIIDGSDTECARCEELRFWIEICPEAAQKILNAKFSLDIRQDVIPDLTKLIDWWVASESHVENRLKIIKERLKIYD